MTIEQQGYVEVQPQYQHVGYVSACGPPPYIRTRIAGMPGLILMGLLLLLTVALSRLGRRWGLGALPAIIAAAGTTLALGGTTYLLGVEPRPALDGKYHETLVCVERACALTEEWTEELGRLPTEDEWISRMRALGCERDPYGYALWYRVRETPSRADGQVYEIGAGRYEPPEWTIGSWSLGQDGVFGTDDDIGLLDNPQGDWKMAGRYTHGRTPRETATQ